MNGHLMIRPTCEKDAAALARIYAYYVEKTAIRLNTPRRIRRKWNGAAKKFRSAIPI